MPSFGPVSSTPVSSTPSVAASSGITGSGSPSLPSFSLVAEGDVAVVGVGSGTLLALSLSGVGTVPAGGSSTATLPAFSLSAAGTVAVTGSASVILLTFTSSSVGSTTGRGYALYLNAGVELRLDKFIGPVKVNLATFAYEYRPGRFYNIVGEADGSTIRGKVWHDGETEPSWQIVATDGDFSAGQPGLVGLAETTVDFDVFATGLGGDPYPTGRNPGTPTWLSPTVPFVIGADPELELVWLRPPMTNGVIGGDVSYELQYRRNIGEAWTDLATVVEQENYLWNTSSLQPNDDYCVRVRCLVACEAGPWAELCSISITEEAEEDCPEDNPPEPESPSFPNECQGGIPYNFDDCTGGALVTFQDCGGGTPTIPVPPESDCPDEEEA